MSRKFKIIHRRYDCIGCGACVNVAPDYWSLDEEGDGRSDLMDSQMKRVDLYVGEGFDLDKQRLNESAILCPVNCIEISN